MDSVDTVTQWTQYTVDTGQVDQWMHVLVDAVRSTQWTQGSLVQKGQSSGCSTQYAVDTVE